MLLISWQHTQHGNYSSRGWAGHDRQQAVSVLCLHVLFLIPDGRAPFLLARILTPTQVSCATWPPTTTRSPRCCSWCAQHRVWLTWARDLLASAPTTQTGSCCQVRFGGPRGLVSRGGAAGGASCIQKLYAMCVLHAVLYCGYVLVCASTCCANCLLC